MPLMSNFSALGARRGRLLAQSSAVRRSISTSSNDSYPNESSAITYRAVLTIRLDARSFDEFAGADENAEREFCHTASFIESPAGSTRLPSTFCSSPQAAIPTRASHPSSHRLAPYGSYGRTIKGRCEGVRGRGTRRTQCAFECDRRGGASMRFHPKSRASIDNRPGPSIVSAPAIVAASRRPFRSSPVVRISEIATTATTAPATGVHNPAMRRSAASASDAEATMGNGRPLDSPGPARQRTTAPTTSRINSKAIPGQPPANVEYRRRNTYLDTIIRRGGATATPTPGRGSDSLGSAATGVQPGRHAARR